MAKLTKRVGENITYNQERKIECSVYCDECSQGTANCKTIREMVKKLAEYEDAEEQGLLLRLPVKIGEKLFTVEEFFNIARSTIYEYTFDGIEKDGLRLMYKGRKEDVCVFDIEEIGKTVFLTKEEAEQALKKKESED